MTSTSREEQAAQLGRESVQSYYQSYIAQFGEPYIRYIKLLLEAAPEDRRAIHEAYQEAYTSETTNAGRNAVAAILDVTVEELDQVFTWIQPPGSS